MKKQVYLAGDGLKKGNQILRNMERDAIKALGTVALHSPWDDKTINDKSKNPTAESIFANDTDAMLSSDIIIVDVDNNSVGTTAEMGQMWGINYMLYLLHGIWLDELEAFYVHGDDLRFKVEVGRRVFEEIIDTIPIKEVYWQTTDIRDTDIPEAGHRRSHSLNQYLYGMMLDLADKEALKFEDILKELKELK